MIQTFMTVYYYSSVPVIFTLFNFALLFGYFFTSFYSLTKAMKLDIATRDLENAESYNNSLTILYDNVRGFKHDFDNMVNIIGGYIESNDIDGLKQYYKSLQKDCSSVRNVQMLNPNVINNPGIYNLIVSKYKKATDLGVTINFEFFFDFENLKMPIYEFSRILGILLDNAIEAAKECDEKHVNLVFRESRKQHVQIVIIENTYLNKDIDTKKIFEKGISGKENHTGIGLWEVNKIIKNNNNIVLKTSNDDKYFKQELQIYF
ncbi:MAG: GHKL domain-containing protein [Clostridia bacterium]|nr:GHKL domain-containing protein [Clostridia bacterium]